MLSRLFTSTKTPKTTSANTPKVTSTRTPKADPKSVVRALQETVAAERARIATLERDNANLIRIAQRLKSDNEKLTAELALSRAKHEKGRRKTSNGSQVRSWNNGAVQSAHRKAV